MSKKKSLIPAERIEQAIYFVRGQKVVLDKDIAALYGVETRVLNQSVRRNRDRFPKDFMFSLGREEIRSISQTVTSPGLKFSKSVFAFTEQGVAMISSVLNSPRAIQVNIEIMRAFVKLRQILSSSAELSARLDSLESKYDGQFKLVFAAIRELMTPPASPKREIGFHTMAVEPKGKRKPATKRKRISKP